MNREYPKRSVGARVRKNFRAEDQEQIAVVDYLRKAYPEVLFTISPASMVSNQFARMKLSRMGYTNGTPDIIIFKPVIKTPDRNTIQTYSGLFIELKRSKIYGASKQSDEQKTWQSLAEKAGYAYRLCYGAQEAYESIDWYLRENC